MKSFLKINKGFTLVELLASVIVLVAIGAVIIGIIASSLRGTNKTNNIENIRQNGNYVINQMSKNIEYAQVFGGFSSIGEIYETSCSKSYTIPTPTPAIATYKFIKVTPTSGNTIIYNCDGSTLTATSALSGVTPLIDLNSLAVSNCSLTCTQPNSTDVPTIGISFTLGPKNQSTLAENNNSITFKTSIIIRNYARQ